MYCSTAGNPYTYTAPSGTQWLDVKFQGGGGAGGSGSTTTGGGGGGAGRYRWERIYMDAGVANVTIYVGQGGANAGTLSANGAGGTQTSVIYNGKTMIVAGGGGGGGGSTNAGGGGGSGGVSNGGNSTGNSGGAAGTTSQPGTPSWQDQSLAGIIGANGATVAGNGVSASAVGTGLRDKRWPGGSAGGGGKNGAANSGGTGGNCIGTYTRLTLRA